MGDSWDTYRRKRQKKRLEALGGSLPEEEEKASASEEALSPKAAASEKEKAPVKEAPEEGSFSLRLDDFLVEEKEEPEPEPAPAPEARKAPEAAPAKRTLQVEDMPRRQQASPSRGSSQGSRAAKPARRTSQLKERSARPERRRAEPARTPARANPRPQPKPKPAKSPQQLEREKKKRREMTVKAMIAALILAVVGLGAYYYTFFRTYRGVRIIRTSSQEDLVSTRYTEFDGKTLKYNQDGAMLLGDSLEPLWTTSYSMVSPIAEVNGNWAVIADRDGTSLVILSPSGVKANVTTEYAIVKATISPKGRVAAVLDGGKFAILNYIDSGGEIIADVQTTLENPGFPLDLSLAESGSIMMVAYQFVDGSRTTSYVAFYNFGSVGQTTEDRIVSGYKYEGKVVPQVEWLSGNRAVAFRDDGFVVYAGAQIPTEQKTVKVGKEIVSTFYDDDNIGLVFKNDDKSKQYTMQVYNTRGDLKFEKDFNLAYTTIKLSRGYILVYNSAQLCVFTEEGRQRFLGAVDGTISEVSRLGLNKYLLVLENGVHLMRLR